jgi:hypothetical protein
MDVHDTSVRGSNLNVAFYAGHEEVKAVKGCEKLQDHVFAVPVRSHVVDVNLNRVRSGASAERVR